MNIRSEDGFTVGGTGEPGGAGADAVGPVVSTESVPCVGLVEGLGWATAVGAAGVSAEPVPITVGTAKTGAKSLSAAGKARPRPGHDRRWRRMQNHERRISPKKQKVVNPHVWPVSAKIAITSGCDREPIPDSTFRAGH